MITSCFLKNFFICLLASTNCQRIEQRSDRQFRDDYYNYGDKQDYYQDYSEGQDQFYYPTELIDAPINKYTESHKVRETFPMQAPSLYYIDSDWYNPPTTSYPLIPFTKYKIKPQPEKDSKPTSAVSNFIQQTTTTSYPEYNQQGSFLDKQPITLTTEKSASTTENRLNVSYDTTFTSVNKSANDTKSSQIYSINVNLDFQPVLVDSTEEFKLPLKLSSGNPVYLSQVVKLDRNHLPITSGDKSFYSQPQLYAEEDRKRPNNKKNTTNSTTEVTNTPKPVRRRRTTTPSSNNDNQGRPHRRRTSTSTETSNILETIKPMRRRTTPSSSGISETNKPNSVRTRRTSTTFRPDTTEPSIPDSKEDQGLVDRIRDELDSLKERFQAIFETWDPFRNGGGSNGKGQGKGKGKGKGNDRGNGNNIQTRGGGEAPVNVYQTINLHMYMGSDAARSIIRSVNNSSLSKKNKTEIGDLTF